MQFTYAGQMLCHNYGVVPGYLSQSTAIMPVRTSELEEKLNPGDLIS